ncbi:NAD(P)H-dependent oxidoreductase [Brachyspira hyodysenteriae]|uniref:Flavodoxin n=1 Tax=Brachyspira hyodysenteriae ATCC 27164 TaxID=1266923 RepID=A0A3B6VXV6_BRAHO|nr:flavodoxin [Brachyspira hyodysenteriae]ANN64732.1 flavodoxin [Brachyspira hyodysenteriae ATCC 27164]KLI23524.1 flavodoxin [Brachyspira hyodysenteriae]KLI32948.1 flavodoxin [Brachyspira hyodysenteriae]MCZ9924099.1 NAD(P)H-dependent oxidoreductase [Brachyspira hyodysenteriae]MDA0033962.1 NAD(P)H-dependent oxidoreductase [Brachyspira hyodysenteriae]
MKKIIKTILMSLLISSTLLIGSLNAQSSKTLIVYFSWGGNTRTAANMIKNMTQADMFEVKTAESYPTSYNDILDKARAELNDNVLPRLSANINNLANYDTVILCYPNWWGTIPQAVKQLLSTHDFSGKKIAPLCTHGGGGMGRSLSDIKSLCPNSTILDNLSISGRNVNNSENNIKTWLQNINIL